MNWALAHHQLEGCSEGHKTEGFYRKHSGAKELLVEKKERIIWGLGRVFLVKREREVFFNHLDCLLGVIPQTERPWVDSRSAPAWVACRLGACEGQPIDVSLVH